MQHLLNHLDELKAWCEESGLPKYRAEQIRNWVAERRATSFAEMSNLPKDFRAQLSSHFKLFDTTEQKRSESPDGTQKLLLKLSDE